MNKEKEKEKKEELSNPYTSKIVEKWLEEAVSR